MDKPGNPPAHLSVEQFSRIIGRTAREARQRLRMTQADVAESVGLVPEVYGRLERGVMTPSVATLRRLCLVLGISSDAALGLAAACQPTAALEPVPLENAKLRRLARRASRLTASSVRALSLMAALLPTKRRAPKSQT